MHDLDRLIKMREVVEDDPGLSSSQKQEIILRITNEMLKLYNIDNLKMKAEMPWVVQYPPQPIPELENLLDNL